MEKNVSSMSSNTSHPLETLQLIEKEWSSLYMFSRDDNIPETCDSFSLLSEEFLSTVDKLKFLKMDFKFLDVILNLLIFTEELDFRNKVQALFQGAAADLNQVRPCSYDFHLCISHLQHKFHKTKKEIRHKYLFFFPEISFQFLANKGGIVTPNSVVDFIDIVVENLSDLLIFFGPNSPLCAGELIGQIEKILKELKFVKSFACFVSLRCIEPHQQHTFFHHNLKVTWHTALLTWLYFPIHENEYGINTLFYEFHWERIQPFESSIKIYIGVLQALKLAQSQCYPVIQIKYMVDCKVVFVENLLHNLEELPISSNIIAVKANLEEMLNFLRPHFTKLHGLEFHLQEINAMIVDAGLLIYLLLEKKKDKKHTIVMETNQVLVPDFRVEIQSMQAKIFLITRKTFLLQYNLPGIDGVGSADFILDNREKFLSLYSNSVDSVKNQLQTILEELKVFQAVVKQEGLQHFVTQTNGLVYEVEYIFDSCKKKDIPDWCLFLWILNIGEDIKVHMAEVAEVQEKIVFDLVLHNTTGASSADTSSQFAGNPGMNEEMVGRKDVMDELKRKLTTGSSKLDVISIAGMPGVGKTTLANKLYFDQSVVSHFDIRAKTCVSQQYTRKNVLLTILGDLISKNAKLDKEAENALAEMLRKKLFHMRYLIFIDDIWHTSTWDDLHLCFPDNNKGSRIILTTRHCDVASCATLVSDPFDLQLLSNDESWMLLKKKVFNEAICPSDLQDVGERIAKECCGLPLSIVLVAGILTRMDKKEHCWKQVATNIGPHIQDRSKGTVDLSYQNLPNHLRPCFLYFGVFSEGREIQVSKLTWLWISEGFVTTQTEKPLEDIANDYLENLVGRNLITVARKSFDGKINPFFGVIL